MDRKRVVACLLSTGLLLFSCTESGILPPLIAQGGPGAKARQRVKLPAPNVDKPVAGSTIFKIDMHGGSFDPPITTLGTGAASIAISPDYSEVKGAILLGDLSSNPIGAHIHRGGPGEVGNAIKTLNVVKQMSHFTWRADSPWESFDQQDLEDLLAGRLYIDIHTEEHPNGEIRGQLIPPQ